MTQGYTRQQLGVTDEMIHAYGEAIFKLSHNHQIRRGDPIRLKDFDAIEAHRHELGMADAQIADRIGLDPAQVTFIRNYEERRRFRTGHYHMLNKLGGGKRFRAERMTPPQDHFRFGADALALRATLAFDPDRAREYISAGWWNGDTLRSLLEKQARERPDARALIGAAGVTTYAALKTRVEKLAAGLWHLGIRPGDVVAVQLPNDERYIESWFAINWIGAVLTTLYLPFRDAEFLTQLAHSRARAAIVMNENGDYRPAERLLALRDKLPNLAHIIASGAPVGGAASYEALAACKTPLPANARAPVAADPFLLLYTSGTTASPKGAALSYHNMLSNARAGMGEHAIGANSVVLSAAPFGHLYGLYSAQLALYRGGAISLLPVYNPQGMNAAIAAHRATHVFAGPAHIAAGLGMGLFDKADLSSVEVVVLSGAAVAPDLVRAFAPKLPNGKVTQLWGMTELQAGLYSRPGDALEISACTAGRASPGTEIRIANGLSTELPRGEEGELQVRGPSVFAGYFDNPDASAAAFTGDGWFRSGDLARMDEAGNVTLTGRVKDVINRGGVKYNPQEVEFLIEKHPAIAQCAIAPVADERLGERACCYAVLKPGAALTLEELCAFLLGQGIARYKLPEFLDLRAALPMTATRKVIKGALRRG